MVGVKPGWEPRGGFKEATLSMAKLGSSALVLGRLREEYGPAVYYKVGTQQDPWDGLQGQWARVQIAETRSGARVGALVLHDFGVFDDRWLDVDCCEGVFAAASPNHKF